MAKLSEYLESVIKIQNLNEGSICVQISCTEVECMKCPFSPRGLIVIEDMLKNVKTCELLEID